MLSHLNISTLANILPQKLPPYGTEMHRLEVWASRGCTPPKKRDRRNELRSNSAHPGRNAINLSDAMRGRFGPHTRRLQERYMPISATAGGRTLARFRRGRGQRGEMREVWPEMTTRRRTGQGTSQRGEWPWARPAASLGWSGRVQHARCSPPRHKRPPSWAGARIAPWHRPLVLPARHARGSDHGALVLLGRPGRVLERTLVSMP